MEKFFFLWAIAGIAFGIIFIVYTNLSILKKNNSLFYLNLFVLFFTLHNIQQLLADANLFIIPLFERKLVVPFYLLIIPSFYNFIVRYLQANFKANLLMRAAILLFSFELVSRLVVFLFFSKINYFALVSLYVQIEEIINLIFTLYLFLKLIFIFKTQSNLVEKMRSFDNLNWVKQFLFFGFIVILLWILAVVYNLKNAVSPNLLIYYPLRIASSLIIIWISYYSFFKINLLTERVTLRKFIASEKNIINVKKDYSDILFKKIETHLLVTQNFLQPNYSILKLQDEVNINHRKIGLLITKYTNKSFTDYLNSFRVEKAKEILKNQTYLKYTIISIALECGFNSKSTFYREFMKQVGVTPTEYRLLT